MNNILKGILGVLREIEKDLRIIVSNTEASESRKKVKADFKKDIKINHQQF